MFTSLYLFVPYTDAQDSDKTKDKVDFPTCVLSSVLPVRHFPRGSVPNDSWKPGGHDGSGVAVGNQQRSVMQCL